MLQVQLCSANVVVVVVAVWCFVVLCAGSCKMGEEASGLCCGDRLGLTRSAILHILFFVIPAVGNLHMSAGPDDFNVYGYFYVRLYWTGFWLPANIVEEYLLLSALLQNWVLNDVILSARGESAGTRELITAQKQNTLIASRVVSRYVCVCVLCYVLRFVCVCAMHLGYVASRVRAFFFVCAVCLSDVVHVAVLRHALIFVVLC